MSLKNFFQNLFLNLLSAHQASKASNKLAIIPAANINNPPLLLPLQWVVPPISGILFSLISYLKSLKENQYSAERGKPIVMYFTLWENKLAANACPNSWGKVQNKVIKITIFFAVA